MAYIVLNVYNNRINICSFQIDLFWWIHIWRAFFKWQQKKTYMISRFTIKYPLFLMLFILTIGNPQLISWSWFMKLWPNNMTLERIQIKKKSFHTNNFKLLRLSKIKHSFLVAKKKTSTDLCRWNETLLMNMAPNFVCIFVTYFAQ